MCLTDITRSRQTGPAQLTADPALYNQSHTSAIAWGGAAPPPPPPSSPNNYGEIIIIDEFLIYIC